VAKAPLPQSYWLVPERILAGEHPWGGSESATQERIHLLLQEGIDFFLDLTEEGELGSYEQYLATAGRSGIRYLRKPIRDHGVPQSAREMQEILDTLERALAEGRRVYLHCRAGIGRTNVVAGCWIASQCGAGDVALERLNRQWRDSPRARSWPSVPETSEQGEFVRRWRSPRVSVASRAASGLRDRVRGLLLGLAAAEAHMHAAYRLPAGAWADKTAMALCLAESLSTRGGHDAHDQFERYRSWERAGLWSSTGKCVGISMATSRALAAAQWTGIPYSGSHDPARAASEPLARIGPAVAWHLRDPVDAIEAAVNCARLTHQAPLTLDAVRLVAALLAGALAGEDKVALLASGFTPAPGRWDPAGLRSPIDKIAAGAWRGRKPRRMHRARYLAADALEAALVAFEGSDDVASCIEAAAALSGEATTNVAIAGQFAGAHFGASSLPASLRTSLARADEIESLADTLFRAAGHRD
jgi:ADP-ribosyl-[dinitrogen reductase] hydrolase